jgi:hypothetical protein
MTLPHFGSTAPQALAVGAPVVSNYRSESTKKICEEPAPIYSIKNVHELIEAIAYYQVKKNRVEHEILATKWVEKYHSKVRLL